MTANAANVVTTITGRVYVAPTTAAAPTASIQALTGFTDLGYIGEDGLGFKPERSTKEIKDMNGKLVRTVITDEKLSYEFSLLESNRAALELYFGSAMVNGKFAYNPSNTGGRKSFVFDVIDGAKLVRHYVPSGEVISVEAQTFKKGEPLTYAVTVAAYEVDGRPVDIFYSEFETN